MKRDREPGSDRSDHRIVKRYTVAQVEAGQLPHRPAVVVFRRVLNAELA